MTTPQWNPDDQFYEPILPPDIEWLAQYFLTPIVNPTPVVTRLPQPGRAQDSWPQGIMRVEGGDVNPDLSVFSAAWDCTFLMHAYSPNETQASSISRTALSRVVAVGGTTINGWYIIRVMTVIGSKRLSDPNVPLNIVRYRSAVTWRIAGQPPTTE